MSKELWFHVDMDAFFASIEQLDSPELRGKPVIVGGRPGSRGVVSTASYEARTFGVRSAMPVDLARRLCPQGIFVTGRMARYQEVSHEIMGLLEEWTPRLIPVSIDEAYLDLGGMEKLLGRPEDMAARIKARIRERTGLTVSIGAGSNKLVAKMASGFRKPDGFTLVEPGTEEAFVAAMALDKIWGLGKKTLERLGHLGIHDTAALLSLSEAQLRGYLGTKGGEMVYRLVRGRDPGIYDGVAQDHSISRETTFEQDVKDPVWLEQVIFDLANAILWRLHREGAQASTLQVKFRTEDFETFTVQKRLGSETPTIESVHHLALRLFQGRWDGRTPLRLLGLGFHGVDRTGVQQGELFDDKGRKQARVESAIAELREKYHRDIVKKARSGSG